MEEWEIEEEYQYQKAWDIDVRGQEI